MSFDIVVLGSANLDLVLSTDRIPAPGETVLATATARHPGGKGLNQAVAAARAGARTAFLGTVGADDAGQRLLAALHQEGIDITGVRRSTTIPTGLAVIAVDAVGENAIVVAPGANQETVTDDASSELIRTSSVLVCQLEIPMAAVAAAVQIARAAGTRVVLNAAPAQVLEDTLLDAVDVLVVNESEALTLAGGGTDAVSAAASLVRPTCEVVITLGAAGASHIANDGVITHVPGVRTRVIDTTGAGDTFVGVLAEALSRGETVRAAMLRAVVAGSLAVERGGAASSIPRRAEIDQRLAQAG